MARTRRVYVVLPRARPGQTGLGTNFEMGKGPIAVGGSLERNETDFTGAYLKLRIGDLDVAAGGGLRDSETVWHGAVYAKGVRWSLAGGGVVGPGPASYQHLAGTWHPEAGTVATGAWFGVERESGDHYKMEFNVADRASLNYLTSWGAYNMDQWPHERTIEAMGDVMRYFLPSIRNHERTRGKGVLGAVYEVRGTEADFTVDGRAFPFRWGSPGAGAADAGGSTSGDGARSPAEPPSLGSYLRDRVLPTVMLGAAHNVTTGLTTVLGEVAVARLVVYLEWAVEAGAEPYLFVQYVLQGL